MKTILAAFVMLIISCDPGQKDFDWTKIETRHSRSEKSGLLKRVKDPIVDGFQQMAKDSGNDQIFDSFHTIDLDNDGNEDLVYNGYGGAAEEFVMIFINHEGELRKALQIYGHVEDLKVKESETFLTVLKKLSVGEEGYDSIFQYKIGMGKITRTKSLVKK